MNLTLSLRLPTIPVLYSGVLLPIAGLLFLNKDGTTDRIGESSRTVYPPQSGLFAIGDYLTGDIALGTTVVSEEGTGSISLSENQLDYTDAEFLWSFGLSNGSTYEHPTIVDTDAIWFDTSGNERHLTGSVADVDAHVHVDDGLTFGSDWLNQKGWSDGVGGYAGVSVPALADGTSDVLGNPLTYPGRAKYDIELVNNTCTLQDGIDTIAFTELVGTEIVVSSVGTSTPSISAGTISFTVGTCSVIILDNGWTIPLEEGSGTAVYAYEGSNNYTGTISASDIDAFWSGEKDGENHNFLYGYELSGLVKIPANPNTGLSVLGQPLTVLPKRFTGQIFVNVECMELMTAELNMTGEELWVDPIGDTIDAANYSTYDSETGICRIVSDGTEVKLEVPSSLAVGGQYVFNFVMLSTSGSTIREDSTTDNYVLDETKTVTGEADVVTLRVKRSGGACDVTFRLSVRKLNSDHTQEVIYDESGNAKELTTETEPDGNVNNQIFIGPKGEAVYEERQTDAVADKALKILGVS